MRLIGITGGVGAGKSEILAYIGRHYKCEIYLADQVANEVKEPGQPCYAQLVELLGPGILAPDGKLDRAAMAARIFGDRELLQKVNGLIHPAVKTYLLEKIALARRNPEVELFFIEAALLIEAGYGEIVDEMWYVHAGEEVRRKRLMESRGYDESRIRQTMENQLSERLFREKSDFVLDNSGSLEECLRQVDERLAGYTRV